MYNTAERKFAQALVAQLHDEFKRAHGKEMHLTPTQLLFAAKHTIEVLLTDITVLETERALRDAPPAAPRVERYGDGVLVHWPEGVEQYIGVGDCVTGNLAAPPAAAVPAANVTPMRQPRADLARLVESINAAVYANGDGLSVTEAIGALELAKLELLKGQEQ